MNAPQGYALALALGMTRPLLAIAMLPIGGGPSARRLFVTPLAIAVGLCVGQAFDLPEVPSSAVYVLALKEAAIGMALGWMIARVFFVVGAAGALMDQLGGYTVGQLFNPSLGRSTGPIESLYSMLLVLILMTAGGGFYLPKMLLATYQAWPVTELLPTASMESFLRYLLGAGVDELVAFSLQMAMPIMAMLMFADICIALFARYAPEFNPMAASLAVKAFVLALMLAVSLASQFGYLQRLMGALTRVQ